MTRGVAHVLAEDASPRSERELLRRQVLPDQLGIGTAERAHAAGKHLREDPSRFSDATATALPRDDERVPVDRVRSGAPPQGWAERVEFERVPVSAEVIAPRTIAIDDAMRARRALTREREPRSDRMPLGDRHTGHRE